MARRRRLSTAVRALRMTMPRSLGMPRGIVFPASGADRLGRGQRRPGSRAPARPPRRRPARPRAARPTGSRGHGLDCGRRAPTGSAPRLDHGQADQLDDGGADGHADRLSSTPSSARRWSSSSWSARRSPWCWRPGGPSAGVVRLAAVVDQAVVLEPGRRRPGGARAGRRVGRRAAGDRAALALASSARRPSSTRLAPTDSRAK